MELCPVTLPRGLPASDGWRRAASLRPLCGRDEAFLVDEGSGLLPAALVTALLSRCLCRLEPFETVTPDAVRALSIGDREALLLHLRRLTLGEKMSCVLRCPNPQCDERMDLELNIGEMLLPPCVDERQTHEALIAGPEGSYTARFRLPNGGDQEAAAPLARIDPAAAAGLIFQRCVQSVSDAVSGELCSGIPEPVIQRLPDEMARLDPQAEILFNLSCPACSGAFRAMLDAASYVCKELAGRRRDFYHEIHLLAFHYHWSERQILSLPRARRLFYLDLLAQSLQN